MVDSFMSWRHFLYNYQEGYENCELCKLRIFNCWLFTSLEILIQTISQRELTAARKTMAVITLAGLRIKHIHSKMKTYSMQNVLYGSRILKMNSLVNKSFKGLQPFIFIMFLMTTILCILIMRYYKILYHW